MSSSKLSTTPAVASGPRPVAVAEDPRVLSALLELATSLPVDAEPRAIAQATIDHVHALAPDCALGACIVMPDGEQIVEMCLPSGAASQTGRDPTRLFPSVAHETVIPLDDGLGSTFHLGSDHDSLPDASAATSLARRTAVVLATALRRSAQFRAAQGAASEEVSRLKEQLIQAEKLSSLGQIVAGVVHELNNPLTSIVAYSDYLKKKVQNTGGELEDIERLQRIGEAAERILKFARDLIAYARPSREIPGPVLVHEIIDKALVFCEHEFSESSVEVSRTFADHSIRVRGVPGQLTQVFVNLFTNASHAMDENGGRLSIKTELMASAESLKIDVSDSGRGITPDVLGRIFEPFFSTKTDGRGTGLGLAIVRDIVTAHGGRLTATSSLGDGTTFTVELPLVAAPPNSQK